MSRTIRGRLKKQRVRRQAVFLVIGCASLLLLVTLVFVATAPRDRGETEAGEENTAGVEEYVTSSEEGEITPAGTLTLGLGGDVTFGLEVAEAVARSGPAYPWTEISVTLGKYDFTVVNLEGPLCRAGEANPDQPSYPMRGDTACAVPMAEAGVDAVCLANDHAMDYGSLGLEQTLNVLHGVGVSSVGAGSTLQAAEQPLLLRGDDGTRMALLSFCDVAPSSYAAGDGHPGIAVADPARMEEAIRKAAGENPYVIVFLHWGNLGSSEITSRQRELAGICARAGADLVVGCHPHVVQGVELIEGVPVFYSLGNLVFYPQAEEGKRGIFLGCRFGEGRLAELEVVPLLVEGGRPSPLPEGQAEGFLRGLAASSPGVPLVISSLSGTASLVVEPGD